MSNLKYGSLLEGRRGNLHADRQTRTRETATNAYSREPGHVKRYGVASQKIARSILEVDSLAVGFDIAAVTFFDGGGGAEQGRRDDRLHFFKGGVELLAKEPPDALRRYVYRSGDQKPGDQRVEQSGTVVAGSCSQIVIMIGVGFRAGTGGLKRRNQIHMRDSDLLDFHAEPFKHPQG